MRSLTSVVTSLLSLLTRSNPQPFELRLVGNPRNVADVHGRTMSRHSTLAEALDARGAYYRTCVETSVTPVALFVVEVRQTCVVNYVGDGSFAVYGRGKSARVEDLRKEIRFDLEAYLAR